MRSQIVARNRISSSVTQHLAALHSDQQLQRTLFVDTDVGFDDVLAIFALVKTNTTRIPFLSTVYGVQYPDKASNFMGTMLPSTTVCSGKMPSSPTTIGNNDDQEPTEEWILKLRHGLDEIMGESSLFPVETDQGDYPNSDMDLTTQIARSLLQYPDESVDLLCLGPLSNLAEWIEDEGTRRILERKINEIWIMGGNIPSSSQEGRRTEAEFNFSYDPKATATVIRCSSLKHKLHIVPSDACEKYSPSVEQWNKIVDLAAKDNSIISKVFKIQSSYNSLKHDTLCAYSYAQSCSVKTKELEFVDVDEDSGLLIHSTRKIFDSNSGIKFVVDIPLNGTKGFLSWLETSFYYEKEEQ